MSNLNSVTVKWEHLDSLTRTREVSEASAVWINIEDDCTVHIYASKQEGLDRAKAMIDRMFQKIEVGKVYTGKVVSITQFVALMKVLPGKDGLAEGRTENVEDIVKKATSSPPSPSELTTKAA